MFIFAEGKVDGFRGAAIRLIYFLFILFSDISNCQVVTAWTGGCSWSDAVELSGSSPGDLARVLSRVLDAMRQFGGLPYTPIRRKDFEKEFQVETKCQGLDQEIRRLCREAIRAINRYPVKDPLSFTTVDDIDETVDGEDSEAEVGTGTESENERFL